MLAFLVRSGLNRMIEDVITWFRCAARPRREGVVPSQLLQPFAHYKSVRPYGLLLSVAF
jgi:hypothetical protein